MSEAQRLVDAMTIAERCEHLDIEQVAADARKKAEKKRRKPDWADLKVKEYVRWVDRTLGVATGEVEDIEDREYA